jgi:hypothetical protein
MSLLAERIGATAAANEVSGRARAFCNAARVIAVSKGVQATANIICREHHLSPSVAGVFAAESVHDIAPDKKAAVAAGTSSGWGSALSQYNLLADGFLESLRNFGAFDAMLPAMRRVPFRTKVGLSTSIITGSIVTEGTAKPISALSLSGGQISENKAVAILVVTAELAKFGDAAAGNLFANELSNAVAVATDQKFIAILTTGAASFASAGTSATGAWADVRALLAAVTTTARSKLFLLTTSAIAKALAALHTSAGDAAFEDMTANGGTIAGITVVVSDGVPAGTMVMVDAQQVCAASE